LLKISNVRALRPLVGALSFFGNDFEAKAFVQVRMQMARVKQEQDCSRVSVVSGFLLKELPITRSICSTPGGKVTRLEYRWQRIKGYLPEEIIGQHFSRFYTPADQSGASRPRPEDRREHGVTRKKAGVSARTARFLGSVVIDAIRRTTGLSVCQDHARHHERRESALKLERLQKQLAESQKLDGARN